MSTPVRASGRDLRTLARIVSEDRPDLPAEGLPPSRQADVMARSAATRCRSTAGTPLGRCAGSPRNSRPAMPPSHTRT
jgi:hypothetical protein